MSAEMKIFLDVREKFPKSFADINRIFEANGWSWQYAFEANDMGQFLRGPRTLARFEVWKTLLVNDGLSSKAVAAITLSSDAGIRTAMNRNGYATNTTSKRWEKVLKSKEV